MEHRDVCFPLEVLKSSSLIQFEHFWKTLFGQLHLKNLERGQARDSNQAKGSEQVIGKTRITLLLAIFRNLHVLPFLVDAVIQIGA